VIGTKGEILTNSHVVEACQTITVKLASGNSQPSALVARDERNDLAVIRLSRTDNSPASIAMFREGLPVRAGDAIVALGYPLSGVLASEANVSVGNVSALAGIAISAPVQPGNSGGPLLDGSGHLVGIVTAKLNALRVARFTGDIPENVNFAIKAEVARTFLDSKGIKYQMERSDKQLSPADIGDVARPFTLQIECERTSKQVAMPVAPSTSRPNKKTEPVPHWGMQITASWSEGKAWATYRLIQKQNAAVIGNREPIVIRSRAFGLGFDTMRYNIRIADDDRAYLEELCRKLIAAGGACVVLRNE
jgi:hypothetical protein